MWAAIAVAAAWVVLQLWGIGAAPFHTKGEPREAIVVQDLMRRGDWVLPRRNAADLPRKPPLFYWLGGVAAYAHGQVDEATVRLPSAVQSGVVAVGLAAVGAALYGWLAGIVAGSALLTSFEWLRAGTSARVDMTLTFGLALCFIGLLLFRRRERLTWLVLVYAGMLWATLSKGIPGLAIPLLQIVLLCVADRSLRFAWRLRLWLGLPVVALLAGGWYVAAAARGGPEFVAIVVKENLIRVVGGTDVGLGHEHSVPYFVGMLLVGLLPWTLFAPSVGAGLWRTRGELTRTDPRLFALLWILAICAPYALATSKRGVYLLPLYPAFSLLLGWWASAAAHGVLQPRWLGRALFPLAWLLAALAALFALAFAAGAVGLPILPLVAGLVGPRAALDALLVADAAATHPLPLAALFGAGAAAAFAAACSARARRWAVLVLALGASATAIAAGVRVYILPALAAGMTRAPFVAAVRRAVADPAALASSPNFDYGTVFYWGRPIAIHDPGAHPAPRFLVITEPEWQRLADAERGDYRPVPGFTIARSNNQGYVILVEQAAAPAGAPRSAAP